MHAQALGHGVVDGVPRIQCAQRILQHQLHLAAVVLQPPVVQWPAFEDHLATRGLLQAEQGARERRLAAAGLPDERDDLAGGDVEVHTVHRAHAAVEDHAQVASPQDRRRGDRLVTHVARLGIADAWERRRERARVIVLGAVEDLECGALLDHLTGVHHRDAIARGAEYAQVMRDEHHAHAEIAHERGEQVEDLRLHHDVQCSCRFVGDDEIGCAGQGHGDHHALTLATRELMRVRRCARCRQPHLLEKRLYSCVDLAVGHGPVQPDRLGELGADALHGIERVQRALEDDRRLAPAHRTQPPPLHAEHVLAVEQHLTAHSCTVWQEA